MPKHTPYRNIHRGNETILQESTTKVEGENVNYETGKYYHINIQSLSSTRLERVLGFIYVHSTGHWRRT